MAFFISPPAVFLDAKGLQQLFEITKGTKLELSVLVGAFYGFRCGEVLGLKWDTIDFERGTISVKRTVTSIKLDGKQEDIEQDSARTLPKPNLVCARFR